MSHALALAAVILVTWSNVDLVLRPMVLERRRATTSWFVLATVTSNAYEDRGLPGRTRYCYRAKYAGVSTYTPKVCAVTS